MNQKLKEVLNKYWGYNNFRGSQGQIIDSLLNGEDVLALLPTGGGKSLCYQLPAIAQPGLAVVVSPLIALIQDQINSLKEKGIKALALTGGLNHSEVVQLFDNCKFGGYKLLYLSPEKLQQPLIQQQLTQLNISFIAIDEAHCISQWGNDFRPAYLHCAILRAISPNAPIIALTATATERVAKDIIENLTLSEPQIFKDSFERPNLRFQVIHAEDKKYELKRLFYGKDSSGIIYVNRRKVSVQLAQYLNSFGHKADFFHGGLHITEKKEKLQNWLDGTCKLMVATSAFGMGVDKADVRLVVHYHLPDSIENYFQEAGRAGRDGVEANAMLLTNKEDVNQIKQRFTQSQPDAAQVKHVYKKLNTYFQIAFGELPQQAFGFNFTDFCQRYQLTPRLTYNALKVLDLNAIIVLSEAFHQQTTIQFLLQKGALFSYIDRNIASAAIIQGILRTYGGLFEFETKINVDLLAKKLGVTKQRIKAVLTQLKKDEVISYQSSNNDVEITFLVPREDDRTINVIAKKITALRAIKKNNLIAMLSYVENTKRCRSQFLLDYFGENDTRPCGKCDICAAIKNTKVDSKQLRNHILKLLKKRPYTSRALIEELQLDAKQILTVLQELLEDEHVELNTKNEYNTRR